MPEFKLAAVIRAVPRFLRLVGVEKWEKRWAELDRKCSEAPFLESVIRERYRVDFAVRELAHRASPLRSKLKKITSVGEYEALELISIACAVHRRTTQVGKKRLRGQIKDALRSDGGFVSLTLNLDSLRSQTFGPFLRR